jgi:hypothetical protein
MINQLFNNIYWKILVVLILSLLITFVNDIDVLKDGFIVYIILAVLMLLIYTKEDMGFCVLVASLFILSYNNVIHKPIPRAKIEYQTS